MPSKQQPLPKLKSGGVFHRKARIMQVELQKLGEYRLFVLPEDDGEEDV